MTAAFLQIQRLRKTYDDVVAIDHNFRPVRPIGLFEVEGLRACAVVCKIFETLHTFLPVRPMIG